MYSFRRVFNNGDFFEIVNDDNGDIICYCPSEFNSSFLVSRLNICDVMSSEVFNYYSEILCLLNEDLMDFEILKDKILVDLQSIKKRLEENK